MNIKIKDIPIKERPRERLERYGVQVLSNEELLAIILKTGIKNYNAKELALNVLKDVDSINDLANISEEKVMKIKGIGKVKAQEIVAALELGRRVYQIKETTKKEKYVSSEDIYQLNKHLFFDKQQEYFYVLYLDSKNNLIKRKLLFIGTINKSIVHPREIFKYAYLLSAVKIICMHNHPSGDIIPSNEDIIFTNSLIEIGKLQNIPIVDHIIFGNNNYYSFFDNNKIIR